MERDIAVVGAGVLGVTTAYWLSELYKCSVVLLDKEDAVARHTTLRNTGLVHRPYYLDPVSKRLFALSAERSYHLWKELASRFDLPWMEAGTLMVATEKGQVAELEKYRAWGVENGMSEEEYELLDSVTVNRLEPSLRCEGAIVSRRDASTDYAKLTGAVWGLAARNGAKLLPSSEVRRVKTKDGKVEVALRDGRSVECALMVNAAGGGSLDMAHMMGLAEGYTDLHFRGEYWVVDEARAPKVSKNVYSVARHAEFPFLDPHYILRADGTRQVGPNAALVSGPEVYEGIGGALGLLGKVFERPITPKVKLFTNGTFLSLVWDEWRSSLSKRAMCERVRRFIPSLQADTLVSRGLAGVRSSLVDSDGFVPEAVVLDTPESLHVLNYNSPGATGAPVFSAHLVRELEKKGMLEGFGRKAQKPGPWNFDAIEI